MEFDESLVSELHSSPTVDPPSPVIAILRTLGIFCGVFVTFPWVMTASVFRLFDSFLMHKLGIQRGYTATGWIQYSWARLMLFLAGVKVVVTNTQNVQEIIDSGETTLGMFQHSSNLDPFVSSLTPLHYRYIGKKSLLKIPIMGWIFKASGSLISIDRDNRENAIATLDSVGELMVKEGISVTIYPEGTRSEIGQINEFKMGGFHLALKARVPIVPMLISGANAIWPKGQLFPSEGTVATRFLPVIKPEQYERMDAHELRDMVRRLMLKENAEEVPVKLEKPSLLYKCISLFTNFVMYILFYYQMRYLFFVPLWWIISLLG